MKSTYITLATYHIRVGHTTKNYGRIEVTRPIALYFKALYFPNLVILTVFWDLINGGSGMEEGRVARSEFIKWEGGGPVYRKVEWYLVEARKWVEDLLVTKIDSEGRFDMGVFTQYWEWPQTLERKTREVEYQAREADRRLEAYPGSDLRGTAGGAQKVQG